jgi:hypothetical protein
MQLSPGERSILSYFTSSRQAQKAVAALHDAGFINVQLDRVSRFGGGLDAYYNSPLNKAQTITGPVLFSGDVYGIDQDTRVLLGADPSVSGYGYQDYGLGGGRDFLVTVVTREELLEQAAHIIKQHDGMM